ncbi:lipid A deacylase LpxR family protein [Crocinitomix catalasitica]|nr:lipid A deacylase LpxR family protein [Crocinitomix catalasitica]
MCSSGAYAQVDSTLYREGYIEFTYENDLFFSTDYYYSQGTHITLAAPFLSKSPVLFFFPNLIDVDEESHSLMLAHDFYTPTNLETESLLLSDRPYACSFYFQQQLSEYSTTDRFAFHTRLQFGILGPWALGEFSQKGIHKLSNSPEPLGWDNQIQNDILLNYAMRFEIDLTRSKFFELGPSVELDIGTVKNQLNFSVWTRMGYFQSAFDSSKKSKNFQLYLSGTAEMMAVAYNAYLQGGLINRQSPHTFSYSEVNHAVLMVKTGLYLSVYNLHLGYTLYYLSEEFKLGSSHNWAKCELRWSF